MLTKKENVYRIAIKVIFGNGLLQKGGRGMNSKVTFVIEYTDGFAIAADKRGKPGFAATDILAMDKELVTRLSKLYSARNAEGKICDAMSELGWLGAFAKKCDGEELHRMIDEIICFRVYMRHFLTKCRSDDRSDAQALELFLEKLPSITEALRKEDMLERTVLPGIISPKVEFDIIGGEIGLRYIFPSLIQLLLFDMMKSLSLGYAPRVCPSCGRYFMPGRRNRLYCDGKTVDGKYCRDVGAVRAHSERVNADSLKSACRAACSRIYTRKCRGKLSASKASKLRLKCRELLEKAEREQVSCETLEEWLREVTG